MVTRRLTVYGFFIFIDILPWSNIRRQNVLETKDSLNEKSEKEVNFSVNRLIVMIHDLIHTATRNKK